MKIRAILFATLLALPVAPALAQSDSVINVSGTIDKVDASSISLKSDEGGSVERFQFAPNLLVVQNKTATLADIKANDFVASAAVRRPDGKLHSTELRIFPNAMRGVGEGQRPMNGEQDRMMTNATVTGTAVVTGSNDITVKFAGGESELVLDRGVPVTRIEVVEATFLKSGEKVRVQGIRNANGASVSRITVQ